jgi:hypothetical protein
MPRLRALRSSATAGWRASASSTARVPGALEPLSWISHSNGGAPSWARMLSASARSCPGSVFHTGVRSDISSVAAPAG